MHTRLALAALDLVPTTPLAGFTVLAILAVLVPRAALATPAAYGVSPQSSALHAAAAPAVRAPVSVQINGAWIPEPPPGTHVAAAYLTISNVGHTPAVLIGASCPLAKSATLHRTMVMNGESMMRPIKRLEIAPSQVVALMPYGMHVMLDGLRVRLAVGERVPLVLRFEGGQEVHLTATVRPIGDGE